MTIVVAVDGDEAAQDQEVGNRTPEAGPEPVPGPGLGISTGVPQEPMGRVSPVDDYENHETGDGHRPDGDGPSHPTSRHRTTRERSIPPAHRMRSSIPNRTGI